MAALCAYSKDIKVSRYSTVLRFLGLRLGKMTDLDLTKSHETGSSICRGPKQSLWQYDSMNYHNIARALVSAMRMRRCEITLV